MRLKGVWLGVAMLLAATPVAAFSGTDAPKAPLNTIKDIQRAFGACWQWPPRSEARSGMELTVRMSFNRDGKILSARIAYQTPNVSDEERALYHDALVAALTRCSPLSFSESLGEAIAGRPMTFHIHDTRQQRKA